jgi:hypothetical protein
VCSSTSKVKTNIFLYFVNKREFSDIRLVRRRSMIDNIYSCVLRRTWSPYCKVVLQTLLQKHLLLNLFSAKKIKIGTKLDNIK